MDFSGLPFPECNDTATADNTSCVITYEKGAILDYSYQGCEVAPVLLPGFQLLPTWFLGVVYALTLVWAFFGVAIISDIFMASIETITAAERTVTRNGREYTVLVWNASVANLTLMALGSSAPEIMLAIIETLLTLGKSPGKLGPSTIVGSAAFNLLVITSVCIMAVPEGERKIINQYSVFLWTSLMSLWAYIWMLVVYQYWTPDQVTILEAWLTVLYLPLLVGLAYILDAKPWQPQQEESSEIQEGEEEGHYQVVLTAREARTTDGLQVVVTQQDVREPRASQQRRTVSDEQIPAILAKEKTTADSQAEVVVPANGFLAKVDVQAHIKEELKKLQESNPEMNITPMDIESVAKNVAHKLPLNLTPLQYKMIARNALTGQSTVRLSGPGEEQLPVRVDGFITVKFAAEEYRVLESERVVKLTVVCDRANGPQHEPVKVHYRTLDGSATAGDDYEPLAGVIEFGPREECKTIDVTIFEDDEVEDDEDFAVELHDPEPASLVMMKPMARVTIVDTTDAGVARFAHSTVYVQDTKSWVTIDVVRKGGCQGSISLLYTTQAKSTVTEKEWKPQVGKLVFESGESKKSIAIDLKQNEGHRKTFTVYLKPNPTAHAGELVVSRKYSRCTVEVVEDENVSKIKGMIDRIIERRVLSRVGNSEWAQQFVNAVIPPHPIGEDGEPDDPSFAMIVLHYVSITWKLIFAVVPPPELGGGLPCFFVSLMMIAGLTYFIAPIASLFGCAVGLSDEMTAIVFVALGTSLPDTFASYLAARDSEYADAAIGNVTGSNSVNVFLGLGLPWIVASHWYNSRGQTYETPRGALAFSVLVFSMCAICCLVLLFVKRMNGGELGGKGFMRTGIACLTFSLWVTYIVLSGLQSKDIIPY